MVTTTHPSTFGRSRAPRAKPDPKPTRLLGPKDLPAKGINYHPNHLRKLWQRGDFPAPIKISARKLAWPEHVIDDWIKSKSES